MLTLDEECELIALLEEAERLVARQKLGTYFPETGPLRRELYQKHLAFFKAGATHSARLFCKANRVALRKLVGVEESLFQALQAGSVV